MTIFVRMLSGKILILEYEAQTTCFDAKKQIEALTAIPVSNQILIWHSEILEDRVRFVDKGIRFDSTLFLTVHE